MELIYAWIGEFRTYKNVGINFSNKFIVNYNDKEKTIDIKRNESYRPIYPDYITNINAIVGKNGVGKTNLLDMIGLRIRDRNINNEEYIITSKDGSPIKGIHKADDEVVHKLYNYFLLYYYGEYENENNCFIFETDNIESYSDMFISLENIAPSKTYSDNKGWASFICNINNKKLSYIDDVSEEQSKLCTLSFRENFSSKNYDYRHDKPEDDPIICIPRRTSKFKCTLLNKKIQFIYNQLQIDSRELFRNTEYTLKIKYETSYIHHDENDFKLPYSYKKLNKNDNLLRLLESYVYYYHNSLYIANIQYANPNEYNAKIGNLHRINRKLNEITINPICFENFIEYYKKLIYVISKDYFQDNQGVQQYVIKSFNKMIDELLSNKLFELDNNSLNIKITKYLDLDKIFNLIDLFIDSKEKAEENLIPFYLYNNFFEYSIEDISDGELAFLDIFTSLYEQIEEFTTEKSQYIILLDEPESRFHPELARTFINQLIRALKDLSKKEKPYKITKSFQVIISTHSPFILSDIPSDNIVYIEKDINGNSIPRNRDLKTLGSNIHTLLKDGFFMSSTIGEYTKLKIKAVIKFLESYKNDSSLENDDTNKEIYTIHSIEECLYIIQSIGEPTIKRKLMKMYNDKIGLVDVANFQNNFRVESQIDVNATINRLQNQIEELKKCITILGGNANDKN